MVFGSFGIVAWLRLDWIGSVVFGIGVGHISPALFYFQYE